jgi:hypothetical protein
MWVFSSRLTSTYDINGKVLTYLFEQWLNSAWSNILRYTYTYDYYGNFLTFLYEQWLNGMWVNNYTYSVTYDNNGNMLTEIQQLWSNGAWVNNTRYSFTYDNNGNELTELEEQVSNTAWVNQWRNTFTYDNNGNATQGEYFQWQNGAWAPATGYLKMTYDERKNYLYYKAISIDVQYTTVTGVKSEDLSIRSYNLSQNYPNPFNPTTIIKYSTGKEGTVKLTVYNVLGSKISELVNEVKPAGNYTAEFKANNLPSGMYLYKLEAGNYTSVKKLVLLK